MRNLPSIRSVIYSVALTLMLPATLSHADEVTPSGGNRSSMVDADFSGGAEHVRFDDAARELTSVYPILIASASQVVQNSFNWNGPVDASLRCDIGFTPDAVVVRGEFVDDYPFCQPIARPAMPEWWMITYGGDGIQFTFDDPTSASRRVSFVLNFGSRATRPEVNLMASQTRPAGIISTADFELFDGQAPVNNGGQRAVMFRAAVPIAALGDSRLFSGPLRITLRMHDLDGDWSTYQVLQEVIERK